MHSSTPPDVNNTSTNVERRRQPRYAIATGTPDGVTIHCEVDANGEVLTGQLLDLSLSGAKIKLPCCLQFSQAVQLRIACTKLGISIDVASQVCFVRPDDDEWQAGCSFATEISQDVIDALARASVIQRRRSPRHTTSIHGIARWELDSESFPVRIRDFSTGGFCLVAQCPGTVGAAVNVNVKTPDGEACFVSGKLSWIVERDGEFLLGCQNRGSGTADRLRLISMLLEDGPYFVSDRTEQTRDALFVAVTWLFILLGASLGGWQLKDMLRKETALSHGETRPAIGNERAEFRSHGLRVTKTQQLEQFLAVDQSPEASLSPPTDRRSQERSSSESPEHLVRNMVDLAAPRLDNRAENVKADGIDQSALLEVPSLDEILPTKEFQHLPETAPTLEVRGSVKSRDMNSERRFDVIVDSRDTATGETMDETAEFPPNRTPNDGPRMSGRIQNHSDNSGVTGDDPKQIRADPKANLKALGSAPSSSELPRRNNAKKPPVGGRMMKGTREAQTAFVRGSTLYRGMRYREAIAAFELATRHDPSDALYRYVLAIVYHKLGRQSKAETEAKIGVQLEQEQPVRDKGARLSRFQGRSRLWLEGIRSKGLETVRSES